jgi:cytosine/adenosine deaminase-related metal-dependent hydrolase
MQFAGRRMPESGERRMIIRARTVVTMDGPPIDNGAVAVSGNRIADVGKFVEIKTANSGEVVDLGEQALLPGLINAHCHLDYTCLLGKIPPPKSFADWIGAINAEKAKLSPKDYLASINEGFAEAKRFGTTTMANLTAFPELISQVRDPVYTWWFAELIDVRSPERANEIVDLVRHRTDSLRRAIQSLNETENWGLAPHALFTASKDLYRRCEEIAQEKNLLLTTHLAESREEMEMFRDASGPLYEFLKSIGRPMEDCGSQTPLGLFVGAPGGRALANWIVAHLNELAERDFKLLESSRTRFHVVHSPRSHDYFRHSRFPFERLRSLGFNICLGTDSLASNESLSLLAEMRAFQHSEPGISPDAIVKMVTANPAMALHQENVLGRIRPGFRADLISIPWSGNGNVFDEIIAFDGSVDWMLLGGKQNRNTSGTARLSR